MAKCDCYYQHGMKFLCYGTKEMEECSCGGNTSKCDFYPEKRNQKTMANEKRLIYANEALRMMRNSKQDNPYSGTLCGAAWDVAHDCAISCVEAESCTVDAVEVVHGRWEDFCRDKMCCCSVCKAEFDNTCNEIHGEWNYCPNCGAKMDGGRSANDHGKQ